MKDLTTWEVRKRLFFSKKWKLVDDFKTVMEAEKCMFRKSSTPLGWLYHWQLRGYANASNGQKAKR